MVIGHIRNNLRCIFILMLIFSCTFFVYLNSLNNPFIWDDEALVVKNPLIRDLKFLPKLFSSDLYSGVGSGSNFYRPLQALSYMWDYRFWQLEPRGFHITNILLHAAVSFFVFLLLNLILKRKALALASALFFSAHPIHTQAVSYISGRADLLMSFFLLSSMVLFIHSQQKNRGSFLLIGLSCLLFVLGLLSKELAVVFPVAVLSYLHYFRKHKSASFPFFLISGAYILLRLYVFHFSTLRPAALAKIPFFIRLTALPKVLLTYLKLLLAPYGLHMSRELARPVSFFGILAAWFILGALAAGCIYLLKNREKRAPFAFFLSWFFIFLLPQSGIFPINAFVSEHFIYLSSISFFALSVFLLFKTLSKRVFYLSVFLILVFYGLLTHSRNLEWANPRLFYERIIKFSSSSFQAYNNLGLEYEKSREFDKAAACYKKTLQIMPGLLEAHSNLASLYFKTGRLEESLEQYLAVEKLSPKSKAGEVENNIGAVYEMSGRLEEALSRYRNALRLDGSLKFSYFNIARAEIQKGNIDAAVAAVLHSFSKGLMPDAAAAKAARDYVKALKNIPPAAVFYNDLGAEIARQALFDDSIACFLLALELEPGYADARFNLGLAYLNKGLNRRAAAEFKAALKADPRNKKAQELLAAARKKYF